MEDVSVDIDRDGIVESVYGTDWFGDNAECMVLVVKPELEALVTAAASFEVKDAESSVDTSEGHLVVWLPLFGVMGDVGDCTKVGLCIAVFELVNRVCIDWNAVLSLVRVSVVLSDDPDGSGLTADIDSSSASTNVANKWEGPTVATGSCESAAKADVS